MRENIFDSCSYEYDEWYKTDMGAFVDKVETEAAFLLLNPKEDEKILDIGCGTGNFSLKLASLECDVAGIDVSEKMLEVAKKKASETGYDICFKNMSGNLMNFNDDTFDKIICMAVFEFVENPEELYSNMLRVLKPNGTIVIGTIQKGGLWEKLYSSEAFKDTIYSYATFKSAEELISLDKDNFSELRECLYIPPGLEEKRYTMENEKEYKASGGIGGFVCVSFKKRI